MAKPQFYRTNIIPVELRCSTDSNACYGKHTHEEFSVGSVDNGCSNYFNSNVEIKIKTGSLVIVNPQEVHACNPVPNTDWSYKMLYVCPKWLGYIQSMLVENHQAEDFIPFASTHTNSPRLYRQFQSLASSIINNVDDIALEEQSISFFSDLYLMSNGCEFNKSVPKENIVKAHSFIYDNFKNNISVKDIALQSGLSEYHLIHAFRNSFGITPHAMQISMRINEAKLLLKRGQNIASVASELGFTDQSHFHRSFKKLVAATPAEYKTVLRA